MPVLPGEHAVHLASQNKLAAVRGDARGIARVTRTLASLYSEPLTDRLGALRCPVRLLVGEKDPMGPRASAIIAEAVPDATLEVVPGSRE